ncbi:MAG: carboxypeptidase-like regulatory domain-containing protein [Terracidiphilus sp.]
MRAAFVVILCCAAALTAHAQDAEPLSPAPAVDRTLATLHGVVRNADTGEGVPRALVRIEGDADTGTLTDGDGRFEISGVPVGPQAVDVARPGFFNPGSGGTTDPHTAGFGPPHNVLIAAGMPDVVFTLAPTGAIRGRIDLSTGDPAEGIEVGLVKQIVADGRAVWQASGFTKTRSDGTYRFGGLTDGQYALHTMPALDSEPFATMVAPGKGAAAERWGYASVYYPDARDPSGTAKIAVANGAEVEANFTLTREPFHAVIVSVMGPQAAAVHAPGNYSTELTDGAGHELPYPTQNDSNAHTIQAALPDGTYSMVVTSTGTFQRPEMQDGIPVAMGGGILVGEVDFAVAGHAITNLRVPLTPAAPGTVQVSVIHGATSATGGNEQVVVMLSPADAWEGSAVVGQYATGTTDGPLQSSYMAPGRYWAHTFVSGRRLCQSSFTAGGASLGREPLTIGLSGVTAPMELAVRDDCAKLALSLPDSLMEMGAGEEKYYTVFVVPDFDFTWDVSPIVLRPTSGGSFTFDNLTPGNYHVYTFEGNANLEYRNPAVLAALANPGQAVTLSPGATTNLVVEGPGQ